MEDLISVLFFANFWCQVSGVSVQVSVRLLFLSET